jgi:glucose dehydrogenase
MVDLTITAANVVRGGDSVTETGTAGATITAGQVVYKEASSGQFKLADSNSGTAEAKTPYGIALHAALTGQPLTVLLAGPVTIGATMTAGVVYYLSDTPGGICPVADLASGEQVTALGIATSATVLNVRLMPSGVTL